jgi:hypothetical protein
MTSTINPLTQAQIDVKRKDARVELVADVATGLLGLGAAVIATVFFPPAGMIGALGAMFAITSTINASRNAAEIAALNKGELELAAGRSDETRNRAKTLGRLGSLGNNIAIAPSAVILGTALTAIFAPAVLSAAVAMPVITALAVPTLALIAVSRVVSGVAKGAQAVVNAADNPVPAAPAAAPEAAAKPARFAALKKLFGRTAAPANDDAKPAAPAAPKAEAPKP